MHFCCWVLRERKSVAAQYDGRLDREYPAKEEVIIYDYIDHHIPVFAAMYHKRMRAYKELGYDISETIPSSTDSAGKMLFSTDDFESQLLQDIAKANKQIIISSASLNYRKVQQLLAQIKPVQERGVRIYLSTWTTDAYRYGKADARAALLESIRLAGVQILYHDDWCPRYVTIDDQILWYGDMDILGKADADSYMMRIEDRNLVNRMIEEIIGRK